jgi:hypothetical protein
VCRHHEGDHKLDGSCGFSIGARTCACSGWTPQPTIEELIERSSLGTPAARAARESVDPALARRVVEASRLYGSGIWDEVRDERARAHIKHGGTSMESLPVDDLTRLTVLMEEVGEVAREFNEARHRQAQSNPGLDRYAIRKELIQVAAMAAAWADAIEVPTFDFPPADDPWAEGVSR